MSGVHEEEKVNENENQDADEDDNDDGDDDEKVRASAESYECGRASQYVDVLRILVKMS